MEEREELKKQQAQWTVKKQQAEDRLKELRPEGMNLEDEHGKRIDLTGKPMGPAYDVESRQIERDIEEANAKLAEIRDKISKLPREQG